MKILLASLLAVIVTSGALAQERGAPLTSSNILNPNLSVIGELVASTGDGDDLPDEAFELSEVEIGLQAAIDPYARADIFVAVGAHGVELEEAALTWLTLPAGLQLKIGKFRAAAGKFNRIHPPETIFADRPLAAGEFFGDHGLAATGASLAWLAPTPFFLELTGEITTNWEEAAAFGLMAEDDHEGEFELHEEEHPGEVEAGGGRSDLGYLLRAETYRDLSDETNLSLGLSMLSGPVDPEGEERALVGMADLTWRWRPRDRGTRRSIVWQTEILASKRDESILVDDADDDLALGAYSWMEWQFARRWRLGLRGDWTERPDGEPGHRSGGLAAITFTPSEFSTVSLQGRVIREPDGDTDVAGFLKVTFSMGPHGTHPF